MEELLQASLAPSTVFATGVLIFVMLYWLIVIVGLLDLSTIDLHLHKDVDLDGVSSVAWFNSALAFFNLGRVPLMFFLSFFALPFWAFSVLANYYLGTQSSWQGFLLMVPIVVVCLFVSKALTYPFVKLFAAMEKEEAPNISIVGQVCTVLIPADNSNIGQASVKTQGAPLLLNVKTSQGHLVQKGDTALVIDYQPEKQLYLIEPYQSV